MSAFALTKVSRLPGSISPRRAVCAEYRCLVLVILRMRAHSSTKVISVGEKHIMAGPRRTIDSYFRRIGGSSSGKSRSERGQQEEQHLDIGHGTSRSDHRGPSSRISTSSRHSSSRRTTSTAAGTATNNGSRAVHRYNQQQERKIHSNSRQSREKRLEEPELESIPQEEDHSHDDPYDLARFLTAQDQLDAETASPFLGTYAEALRQLRRGRKTGHWVWYVFPQMPIPRPTPYSSGRISEMSKYYGIRSLGEARAYLEDEVLGARLMEITRVVLDSDVNNGEVLMGGEGDLAKLGSCMTLFARAFEADMGEIGDTDVKDEGNVFQDVLRKYFDNEGDALTEEVLDREEQ